MRTKTISTRIETELKEVVKKKAKSKGLNVSDYIKDLIAKDLERGGK